MKTKYDKIRTNPKREVIGKLILEYLGISKYSKTPPQAKAYYKL